MKRYAIMVSYEGVDGPLFFSSEGYSKDNTILFTTRASARRMIRWYRKKYLKNTYTIIKFVEET